MEITLNHTIVPSHNNVESARFYERIFGFEFVKEWGHFAVVKVNSTFTLDFDTDENFTTLHFAFKVNESQFDEILGASNRKAFPLGVGHGQKTTEHSIPTMVGAALTLKTPMATSWKFSPPIMS